MNQMEKVSRRIESMVEDEDDDIDALFAEIDGNLIMSRQAMR
jgi:hypothetical protein